MNVLYIEDEQGLAKIVADSLLYKGYKVSHFTNAKEALGSFIAEKPDIIVLDIMMPETDGFTLASKIRESDLKIPIIFVTARTQTKDVVYGFEIGANDYLKKPFSIDELIVRMNFQLKLRNPDLVKRDMIGKYFADFKNQRLILDDKYIRLSYRESELLKRLFENKNTILKRKEILEEFWDYESFFTGRSLDVFISRLRAHLKEDPTVSIVNVRGAGYMLIVRPGE